MQAFTRLMQTTFLGWDRPLCETVPAHLLAGAGAGLLDLRGTVVVVPTRQSSWRLRAALPLAAAARGAALLGPEIVTPPVLLEPPRTAAVASSLQSLLAWTSVLNALAPGDFPAFLGTRENRPSGTGWALQVARRLQDLRRELADGGLTIRQVAGLEAVIEERDRWCDMAELERRQIRQLEAWQLRDALDVKLDNAQAGALPPDIGRVIVAAVPDPPKLFMALLDHWAAAGCRVEILVAAPEHEAAAFDAWGRPAPDAWQTRAITLRDEDLWLDATPEDQAGRIARTLAEGLAARPAADAALRPQLAIGAPDRETVAPLQRELAAIGLPAFDPQNRPLAESALFRLVQALLALRDSPGYAETATLLRHPDVLAALGRGADVLRQLDAFQSEHFPVTLDDLPAAAAPHAGAQLAAACVQLSQWRAALKDGDLAAGLRHVLQQIYAQRLLVSGDPADAAFQQAVATFDTALRELEDATQAGQAGDDAGQVLMARLREGTVKAERRDEHLDLEGWLELAWNPAPLLCVCGVNEGFVPDGHVGDLFLPDTLRRRLELRDDRLRVARDAYVLTALLEQRRAGGRVVLVIGKTSIAGDPLRPSRLLFRCPDTDLVGRARLLFGEPPAAHAASAFTVSFRLDPARVPATALNDKRSREMSPTLFRAYLACPLRFYLQQVLGMESVDDRAREPDALAFGTRVHDVLDAMAGEGRGLWGCGDPDKLAQWLEERLRRQFRSWYGARPWLGVELALDSAARRLQAFARKQVAWHQEGWEIAEHEDPNGKSCVIGGLKVKGRIDRIDRNARTGKICVLDYKTTDKSQQPQDVHFGAPREEEDLEDARIPKVLTGKSDRRWADLQLPLYREFVKGTLGADVQLGYILLPNSLGDTGFAIWASYSDALHASAIACAEAVAARIRGGTFWPPGKLKGGYRDDFAGVLLDDPVRTLVPPPAPWRSAP